MKNCTLISASDNHGIGLDRVKFLVYENTYEYNVAGHIRVLVERFAVHEPFYALNLAKEEGYLVKANRCNKGGSHNEKSSSLPNGSDYHSQAPSSLFIRLRPKDLFTYEMLDSMIKFIEEREAQSKDPYCRALVSRRLAEKDLFMHRYIIPDKGIYMWLRKLRSEAT